MYRLEIFVSTKVAASHKPNSKTKKMIIHMYLAARRNIVNVLTSSNTF